MNGYVHRKRDASGVYLLPLRASKTAHSTGWVGFGFRVYLALQVGGWVSGFGFSVLINKAPVWPNGGLARPEEAPNPRWLVYKIIRCQ